MEVIQSLLEAGDRTTYAQRLKEAAVKLGKSVRTGRLKSLHFLKVKIAKTLCV
ncbi:hypothetical protein [Sphaerospermopsis sp. LEGE 00249]|uniref:hypothetical protein n=1 Tax=Sphaerospermopsis sp. LEGE 00249 TaxID=1380707 RepID=UPI001C9A55B3|nr:hypothetical protein [Sphaerospermopsis sp. LEGE 00249]